MYQIRFKTQTSDNLFLLNQFLTDYNSLKEENGTGTKLIIDINRLRNLLYEHA
jgi:hypothetical protein